MTDKIPSSFWVSRDSDVNGVLSDRCDVWTEKPNRTRTTAEGGAFWLDKSETGLAARHSSFLANVPPKWVRTIPETDRELVVHE